MPLEYAIPAEYVITATSLAPSLEDATLSQFATGELVGFQVPPESALVYIKPPATAATSLVPVLEDAIDIQNRRGALVLDQLLPESALV